MWGPGRKVAFGAPAKQVWYTLADGSLSEVFFPTLDRVALHELRFFASAPGAPPVDDASDGQHSITWLSPGVPAFTVESTHHEYRLTKEFVSDPDENAMIISGTFTPELPDVRLFMQASAHWSPELSSFGRVLDASAGAAHASAGRGSASSVLSAARRPVTAARPSCPGTHDGWLHHQTYDRAGPAQRAVGELGVRSGTFQPPSASGIRARTRKGVARHALQKAPARGASFARAWHATRTFHNAVGSAATKCSRKRRLAVLYCPRTRRAPVRSSPAQRAGGNEPRRQPRLPPGVAARLCRVATAPSCGRPGRGAHSGAPVAPASDRRPDLENWNVDGSPRWIDGLDRVALPILLAWRPASRESALGHGLTRGGARRQFLIREAR
jgi:glucoamylase